MFLHDVDDSTKLHQNYSLALLQRLGTSKSFLSRIDAAFGTTRTFQSYSNVPEVFLITKLSSQMFA